MIGFFKIISEENSNNHREMSGNTYQFKIVLLGDSNVGKSSIVLRVCKDEYKEFQENTIGAAFMTKTLEIDRNTIKFEIWDTAGQERYHSLTPMYYRGCNGALIVFDITSDVCKHIVHILVITHRCHSTKRRNGSMS